MTYKVIWFDDEHENLDQIKEKAWLNDIELIGFDNAQDGLSELEKNPLKYDAAILDGNFYHEKGLVGMATDDRAFGIVARKLDQLPDLKMLPWFILSGQMNFTREKNSLAATFKDNKVYDKLKGSDLEELWKAIKLESAKQPETVIRHQYQKVFEVCTAKYIGEGPQKDLLEILKKEKSINNFHDSELHFNQIRKILEDIFLALNRYGLLPDFFITGGVKLNPSAKFLSGLEESNYYLESAIFPEVIKNHVRNILSICQPAAHRSHISSFMKELNSPFLLFSITYQLLDVLVWLKKCIDENGDYEKNKSKVKLKENESENIEGLIEIDSKNNYHVGGKVILTYTIIGEYLLKAGDRVRILESKTNSSPKTADQYVKSATKIEKTSS